MTIVPNVLRDKINLKLDEAFLKVPEASQYRDVFYQQLLEYFDEHGEIPEFDLVPNSNEEP